MTGQRNDAYHPREMHFLKFHSAWRGVHLSAAAMPGGRWNRRHPSTHRVRAWRNMYLCAGKRQVHEEVGQRDARGAYRSGRRAHVRARVACGKSEIASHEGTTSGRRDRQHFRRARWRADPRRVVRYQGKKIAKTKVCSSTLASLLNAVFEFTVPTHAPTEGEAADLLIEVFDHDLVGSDDFLGVLLYHTWSPVETAPWRRERTRPGLQRFC